MPEGDTIHRLAKRFAPLLVGKELIAVALPDRMDAGKLQGAMVSDVMAVGKHLLMMTDRGTALRTHLGMDGRWDVHPHGQRWAGPRRLVTLTLATAEAELVLFEGKSWQVLAWRRPTYGVLATLGPDLSVAPADVKGAALRAAAQPPSREVAEVLLDQRVACGIGNVYKSELLFVHGVHPQTPVAQIEMATWEALFGTAAKWLLLNIQTPGLRGRRTTGIPPRRREALWVYDRLRRPCLRCATAILVRRQGELARPTWWCPRCQPHAL